jgi:hypothetical protein
MNWFLPEELLKSHPVPSGTCLSAAADYFLAKAQRPARRGGRKEILIPSEAVDGKIYFFSPKGAEPAFRRLCGFLPLASLKKKPHRHSRKKLCAYVAKKNLI